MTRSVSASCGIRERNVGGPVGKPRSKRTAGASFGPGLAVEGVEVADLHGLVQHLGAGSSANPAGGQAGGRGECERRATWGGHTIPAVKSLSQNPSSPVGNPGAGEVEEGFVVGNLLLPPDQ